MVPRASLLVIALLALPAAAQDPTPFWMPAPPAKKKPEAPPKKRAPVPEPAPEAPRPLKKPVRAPVKAPEKKRKAEPPPVVRERAPKKKAAPAPSLPEEERVFVETPRPAPVPASPAPAAAPEDVPSLVDRPRQRVLIPGAPPPAPPPIATPRPAPEPAPQPVPAIEPARAAPQPAPPPPTRTPAPDRAQPAPATKRGSLPPIPDVSPADLAPARSPAASPAPAAAAPVSQPTPVFVPAPVPVPVPAPVASPLPREPDMSVASADDDLSAPLRRWSFSLGAGLWGIPRADGSGRASQTALAGRFGIALFHWLEVDLAFARASNSDGTAFAGATDVHTLLAARAMLAWSLGPVAVLGGAGGGVVLVQTQYTLQDVGATAITLSSSGIKPVLQPAAALRLRPWRGLEARAEVSTVLRDGRFETMLLGTLGYSF